MPQPVDESDGARDHIDQSSEHKNVYSSIANHTRTAENVAMFCEVNWRSSTLDKSHK